MATHDVSDRSPRVNATRARQGRWGKHVLWVLVISTALAAIVLMTTWGVNSGNLADANAPRANSAAEAVQGTTVPGPVMERQGQPAQAQ